MGTNEGSRSNDNLPTLRSVGKALQSLSPLGALLLFIGVGIVGVTTFAVQVGARFDAVKTENDHLRARVERVESEMKTLAGEVREAVGKIREDIAGMRADLRSMARKAAP